MASLEGHASIRGNSEMVQMILLNICAIGITFTWGIEMTYCTPYLLKLGLTKSSTSLVWVAGPLSGLIVQPIIGVLADESTSPWGRRRPLMLIGAIIVAVSLLVLGFTREIIGLFVGDDDEKAKRPTIVLAVFSIYVVDFAINAVMSCSRSLIVDTLAIEKQQAGAAWASRMSSVGHVLGYGAGAIDLVRLFGTGLGSTQFKQLTIIAAMSILASTTLTCWAVSEKVLVPADKSSAMHHQGYFKVFRQIYSTVLHLPPRIRVICWVQFWSWIGWFPFLFYSTTWIGETYFRYDAPADSRNSKDTLGDMGRIGSIALVFYSGVTFTGALILPLLVKSPDDEADIQRPPQALAGILDRFNKVKPDLLTAWICGHFIFSAAMALAPLARSFISATVLVCICGVPWTIAMWAPPTFLGIEVNKLSSSGDQPTLYRRLSNNMDLELPTLGPDTSPRHESESETSSTGELSGVYFGILNIFTTLPQFIGTFIAAIVFAILEPGESPELAAGEESKPSDNREDAVSGPNAISVCLFIGAMSTLVAAFVTRKLKVL
ncbi:General alpha-glucoside permease [Cladobotryum mycophilum]|uniref:General alpha-glucoside permease n=1 Tax=Cladobotryum mycophilum TaxID=491253 RepID=A0ABR0SFA8_9HYPO